MTLDQSRHGGVCLPVVDIDTRMGAETMNSYEYTRRRSLCAECIIEQVAGKRRYILSAWVFSNHRSQWLCRRHYELEPVKMLSDFLPRGEHQE